MRMNDRKALQPPIVRRPDEPLAQLQWCWHWLCFSDWSHAACAPGEPWSPQALPAACGSLGSIFGQWLLFFMHASELIQLAAMIATHGSTLVLGRVEISPTGLQSYWTASKCRLDRWSRLLADYPTSFKSGAARHRWQTLRPVIEEILLSEVLVRVWTAVLASYDRHSGAAEAEPIARSVFVGQMEARHRAMKLLIHAPGVRIADAIELNRLRRKAERWTDLLLARLDRSCQIDDLATDIERAREFAADLEQDGDEATGRQSWSILLASLRGAFNGYSGSPSPNCDLNERIAASILACFPGELFDTTYQFHSLWAVKLRIATDDAQEMLDELWNLDGAAIQRRSPESDLEERLRRQ